MTQKDIQRLRKNDSFITANEHSKIKLYVLQERIFNINLSTPVVNLSNFPFVNGGQSFKSKLI